jgi:hypothetical protein
MERSNGAVLGAEIVRDLAESGPEKYQGTGAKQEGYKENTSVPNRW